MKSPPLSFLDLPPELRYQIYPHIVPTVHLDPRQYVARSLRDYDLLTADGAEVHPARYDRLFKPWDGRRHKPSRIKSKYAMMLTCKTVCREFLDHVFDSAVFVVPAGPAVALWEAYLKAVAAAEEKRKKKALSSTDTPAASPGCEGSNNNNNNDPNGTTHHVLPPQALPPSMGSRLLASLGRVRHLDLSVDHSTWQVLDTLWSDRTNNTGFWGHRLRKVDRMEILRGAMPVFSGATHAVVRVYMKEHRWLEGGGPEEYLLLTAVVVMNAAAGGGGGALKSLDVVCRRVLKGEWKTMRVWKEPWVEGTPCGVLGMEKDHAGIWMRRGGSELWGLERVCEECKEKGHEFEYCKHSGLV